jgi:DNA-binding transcriptional MerR regulator
MENENNVPNNVPDFSDIPALGDAQGLENYLNNEALAAQGIQVQNQQPEQPKPEEQQQQVQQQSQQPQGQSNDTITLSREQLNAILASRGQMPQQAQQPQQQVQPRAPVYSAQEQQFIARALAQGYSLDQINRFLYTQRGNVARGNPILEQRLAQVEQYLRTQEYKTAETAFINRLSDFGNKWGLSEQDLVNFGNTALQHGINIAGDNVDLEMVFRAIYPEQYSIRSRRMTPTNSSQIYGGTSIPEGSRASASKLEDAYVENFLKGAMPNQYGTLNKK